MMKDRPKAVTPNSVSGIEQEGLKRMNRFLEYGTAYALEHATRPSTIGLVLASNPLALLAWIGEKFLDWSDVHPPLQAILESVSLYWFTQTFPRSIYTYRERFDPAAGVAHEHPEWRINKPMGYSWFPKEVAPMPRAWVATTGGLVFWREHEQGGHFAAMEQPELLLEDLREFIEQVWTEREFLAER
jgi:microsomal epoxide hydrolase